MDDTPETTALLINSGNSCPTPKLRFSRIEVSGRALMGLVIPPPGFYPAPPARGCPGLVVQGQSMVVYSVYFSGFRGGTKIPGHVTPSLAGS